MAKTILCPDYSTIRRERDSSDASNHMLAKENRSFTSVKGANSKLRSIVFHAYLCQLLNGADTGQKILLLVRSSRNFLSTDMYLSASERSNLTTLSAISWQ